MRAVFAALVTALALGTAACSKKPADPRPEDTRPVEAKPAAPRKLRVAAAADLTKALGEVTAAFQARTGTTVEVQFGASGLLAKQIEQGAPFALFAAANRSFVDQVVQAGKCDGATVRSYARGRVVVWTPAKVLPPTTLADLADPRFTKIAIANPDTAPYGKAARQALEKSGVWPKIQDRIVLGENVQATLTYAIKGNVDAALVALSLAIGTEGGSYLPVDPELHAPLDQALVVCGTGPEADDAKKLAELIASPEGRVLMNHYGFLQAGEPVPTNPPPTAAAAPKTP
jgi:molybdate transport system substrate-binding protein